MTKNDNVRAISTERNGTFKIKVGNCAIDVEKLSNNFIINHCFPQKLNFESQTTGNQGKEKETKGQT